MFLIAFLVLAASAVSAQPQNSPAKLKPGEQDVHYANAQASMKMGKYLDALKELNKSIVACDKCWWLYLLRAKVLMGLNCYPEAIHDLDKLTKIAPASRNAVLMRALFKSHVGQRQGSIEDFGRAVRLAPKGPIALASEKELVNAVTASAERSAQKMPEARTYLRVAFANLLNGNYVASTKASALAAADEKVRPNALVVSAYAKFFFGQKKEAFADARKAAALRRHDLWFHLPLINLHQRAGTMQKALSQYDALIKSEPRNSTFYACRAEIYGLLKNNAKAVEDLSTAIMLESLQSVLYQRRAALYVVQHNTKAALIDLTQAIKQQADNGELYEQRAKIFAQQGEYSKAEADFSKAIALSYNLAKNYEGRAACFRKLGRPAAASADMVEVGRISHPID